MGNSPDRFMLWVKRWALSRNAAVAVMALMGLVLAFAALVPQADVTEPTALAALKTHEPVLFWIGEHLRPQAMVQSPFFLALPVFLCAGIGLSLVQRIEQFRRQAAAPPAPGSMRFKVRRELTVALVEEELAPRVGAILKGAGYRLGAPAPGSLAGSRGRVGFLGSIGFHIGLILVLVGVVASSLTRFHGEIMLAEGFPEAFSKETMFGMSGASRFQEMPGVTLAIRDFTAQYSDKGTPVDFSLLLAVRQGDALLAEKLVRVNQAFHWGGFQLTLHRYGFAPELVAWDRSGTKRLDGVAGLMVIPPGKEDSVALDGGGSLRVSLYPDFATIQGAPASRSLAPVRPVLAFEWDDDQGRTLAQGRVAKGATAEVKGYRVAFPALSYWGGFIVARDQGLWFFILGSVFGSLGIALRLSFPDQAIKVAWAPCDNGTRLTIDAGARFFPALHEEQVDRLLNRIAEG